jgi:hypothetical protein
MKVSSLTIIIIYLFREMMDILRQFIVNLVRCAHPIYFKVVLLNLCGFLTSKIDYCRQTEVSNCSTISRGGTLTIVCCGSNRVAPHENLLCGRCLNGYSEWEDYALVLLLNSLSSLPFEMNKCSGK